MDPGRFDTLARSLAAPRTRRGLLSTLASLGAGLLGARTAGAQVSQVSCGNQTCASNPGSCKPGCVCCAYTNSITGQVINSRCRPPGTCSPGAVACPPGQVLGPSGVCAAPTTTTTTTPPPRVACVAGDNVCTDTPIPFCGGPSNCVCFATVQGGTYCGGGNRRCADCTTDAQCEVITGVAGSACVSFEGDPEIGCGGCVDTGFHGCVEPCPQFN